MERALHIHNDRALSETEQRQKGDRQPAGKEHFLEVERKSLHAVRAELVGDLRLVVYGAALTFVVLFMPGGLAQAARVVREKLTFGGRVS